MGAKSQQSTDSSVRPTVSDDEDGAEPDRDEMFHVLRNQRRRYAIHYLKYESDPIDVGELATQVAAWENEVTVDEVTSKQRRRVYNSLKQTHIPSLTESDFIEEDRGELVLTEQAEKLDIYLELVPEKDIPWSEYYLGIGAVGLTTLVVTGLDIGPFAVVSDGAVGVFLAVALVLSALAHYYSQHRSLIGDEEKPPELRGD